MDAATHAVALVILLRCANVRLAPVVSSWGSVSLEELFQVHELLCQKDHGEYWATQVCMAFQSCYDWDSLSRGHAVLKEQWFRYLKTNVPLSVYVLSVGERLEKSMRGSRLPFFEDHSDLTWFQQCEQALLDFTAASSSSADHEQGATSACAAPATPPVAAVCKEPETPCVHYLSHLEASGPPSPLATVDSPWTKQFKTWYSRQVDNAGTEQQIDLLSMSDREPEAVEMECPARGSQDMDDHDHNMSLSPCSKDIWRHQQQMWEESDDECGAVAAVHTASSSAMLSPAPLASLRLMGPEFDPPRISDTDPIEDVDSPSACEAVSAVSVPDNSPVSRFQGVAARRTRECKYGRCPTHDKAMKITVGYSGLYAGKPVCRCPFFWTKTEDGKPSCWQQKPWHGPWQELPQGIRAKVRELKGDLRWSLRHGPSTR